MRKGLNVYVEDAKLDTLPFTEIKFLRDEKDKSLFFFRNGIIEVTKNDIVLKSYSELKTPIWKSQIIDFDVEIIKETNIKKFEESDFLKFCQNVCTKRCETGNFVDQKRFDSLMTVLGYLCNNYKDLAYPKAVIFSDASLENKPEGGSGKGILAQAVGQLRKMAVINGKKFDWDNRFNLSKVTRDTHFVYFDDVGKNFDMEKGFSLMSEGYEIERKNKDSFRLGYKESPKTGMSTNYSMKGEGSSHRRRKQEFELYNYYNDKFTPDMDFGRLFFSEQWDFNQWNLFYNFMFQCVQSFFDNNCRMKECVSETLEMKKLRNEVGINFIEFMGKLDHNTWLQLDEIYEEFAQDFLSEKEGEWYSKKKFAMSLQKYCDYYQLDLKSDRRTVGSAKRTFYFIKKDFQK